MNEIIKEKWKDIIRQIIKFGIVGFINTVVGYIIYYGFLVVFEVTGVFQDYDYLISQIIMYALSIAWSYYWNQRVVFHQLFTRKEHIMALAKAYVMYGFSGVILSGTLLYIWIEILFISKYIAPLINVAIITPINFVISKLWVYKK